MTYAEFIESAVEQFARHGIDVDGRVRAVINNLAMVVAAEDAARMDERARASDLAWAMEAGPQQQGGE